MLSAPPPIPVALQRTTSSLRRKLTAIFVVLAIGAIAGGAIGLHSVSRVANSVTVFTDVTTPMLSDTLSLLEISRRLRATATDAGADGVVVVAAADTIERLHREADERISNLERLSEQANLGLPIAETRASERGFATALRKMLLAHFRQVEAERAIGELRGQIEDVVEQIRTDVFVLHEQIELQMNTARLAVVDALNDPALEVDELRDRSHPLFAWLISLQSKISHLEHVVGEAGDAVADAARSGGDIDMERHEVQEAWFEARDLANSMRAELRAVPEIGSTATFDSHFATFGRLALSEGGLFAALEDLENARAELAAGDLAAEQIRLNYFDLLEKVREGVISLNQEARRTSHSVISQALILVGLTLVVYLVAAAVIGYVVASRISGPIGRLTQHATRISLSGDLSRMDDASIVTRLDEIGALARAFNSMLAELAYARRTILEQSEAEIQLQHDRLKAALSSMSHGLIMLDNNKEVVIANERMAELWSADQSLFAPGTSLRTILESCAARGLIDSSEASINSMVASADLRYPTYFNVDLSNGRVISISHKPTTDGGSISVHEDVTERKAQEARIAFMALHDMLTELPNRVAFREGLEKALSRAARGHSISVICFDLDHFKAVNDTLGHPVGDALLKLVAGRVRSCLRPTDMLARLGGDEFAIVQLDLGQPQSASSLAERLIAEVSRPYEIDSHKVVIGASVGIAIAPDDGLDPDEILRCADMALYRSKERGRGTHSFFEPDMNDRMQERRKLELDLRGALAAGQFELFYQPLVKAESGSIGGFEALLRWRHPERGLVAPADFIPMVEEIGVIGQVGRWALREACLAAATWPADLTISVNLSPVQFKSGLLVDDVRDALEEAQITPSRLELEITEQILLDDAGATVHTLQRLRDLGVRIAMDDFGTGYSSLGYLRLFPFDKIKIDRSFMRDFESAQSVAIVRAVAGLANTLGIATVAEGIETEEQLVRAQAEGCQEVQGYLFSRPIVGSEVAALLARTSGATRAGVPGDAAQGLADIAAEEAEAGRVTRVRSAQSSAAR
ncbi:EAL domain-containing protein [Acuticoccus yangtzensis]|uniref:EAL domain-containing protein n=1 Tax=Acuticoccus yangtzensis TaxID=1443441 RepID=UPI0009FB010F|nr:EAL domain-containing protein [Acuticoccus yangtzensis]